MTIRMTATIRVTLPWFPCLSPASESCLTRFYLPGILVVHGTRCKDQRMMKNRFIEIASRTNRFAMTAYLPRVPVSPHHRVSSLALSPSRPAQLSQRSRTRRPAARCTSKTVRISYDATACYRRKIKSIYVIRCTVVHGITKSQIEIAVIK